MKVTEDPAIEGEVASIRDICVGARTTTLVHVSSPRSPVGPLIPEKVAVTLIGPGSVSGLTRIYAEAVPLESVSPPHTVMLSTSTTTVAEGTGDPELSMIDRDISNVSPRIVLLSGSRSSGLSIVSTV